MPDKAQIVQLPKISDPRGNLTFIEENNQVPFRIRRVYYLYDVPAGETRGGHAHLETEQFMIAVSGSFDVNLENIDGKKRYTLNRPFLGLYIPKMTWRTIENFSSGAVCLVLASTLYNENDYIRDYDYFRRLLAKYDSSRGFEK